jgi:hypothetical protein
MDSSPANTLYQVFKKNAISAFVIQTGIHYIKGLRITMIWYKNRPGQRPVLAPVHLAYWKNGAQHSIPDYNIIPVSTFTAVHIKNQSDAFIVAECILGKIIFFTHFCNRHTIHHLIFEIITSGVNSKSSIFLGIRYTKRYQTWCRFGIE